jgi:CBS domain-containing protein
MTKARDVMHSGAQCIGEDQSLADAARMMRDMGVGALPICGSDDKLKGMLTDRDIVVKCVAEGMDCNTTTAGQLAQGTICYVDCEADIDDALAIMREHQVKRLPVMEDHRLVGMISETDLARMLDDSRLSGFIEKVYSPT